MITVETNIPVHCVAPKQIFNPPSNKFAVLDFHQTDWPNILLSLQSIDWVATLEPIPPSSCFVLLTLHIINVCIMFSQKNPSKPKISKFHRERNDFDAKTDKALQNEFHKIDYLIN